MSFGTSDAWFYAMSTSGSDVHIAEGNGTIFYRRSTNEGASWSPRVDLGSGYLYLEKPVVADGANVYVSYFKNIRSFSDWCCSRAAGDLYLRASRDGGATWQPEIRLSTAQSAYRVSVAASGNSVHVVWMDFRRGIWDIYYRRSIDRGLTWGPETQLVVGKTKLGTNVGAERPSIEISGNSVHVVWMDGRDGQPACYTMPECTEVYYKRSLDGGTTWESDVRLTTEPAYSGRPVITSAGNNLFVAYDQSQSNSGNAAYLLTSANGGTTWSAAKRVSTSNFADHTTVHAQNSSVFLSWYDMTDSQNSEVYFRISNDLGNTFGAEERVSNGVGDSTAPYVGSTTNYVHFLWGDRRTGTMQVFYRRRSLGQ